MNTEAKKIRAIDLFCGAGGLTHGLVRGGIDVVAGIDLDPMCRYPFEANNSAQFIQEDVSGLNAKRLRSLFGEAGVTLLAGCAPCQPFSTYSRSGRNPRYNEEWPLVSKFGELVKRAKPDLVTMENVPQVADHSVFGKFLENLSGYHIWWGVVDCSKVGIPQTRKRLVLLASKIGNSAPSIENIDSKALSVRDAIGKLPPLRAGETDQNDDLHTCSKLSDINLRRIRASRPGGTWRDWDPELLASCHKKSSGATYPSVYGRMEWDKPSPTITTQCFGFGNGRFGHPEQDRAISLREAAMIQTFPRSYRFTPPGTKAAFDKIGRLIGNAVPVKLGEVIAQELRAHVAMAPA